MQLLLDKGLYNELPDIEPPCMTCAAKRDCATGLSCSAFSRFVRYGESVTPLHPEPSVRDYRKQFFMNTTTGIPLSTGSGQQPIKQV